MRRQAIPDFLAATDVEKLEGAFEKLESDEEGSEISARETGEREERHAEMVEYGGPVATNPPNDQIVFLAHHNCTTPNTTTATNKDE